MYNFQFRFLSFLKSWKNKEGARNYFIFQIKEAFHTQILYFEFDLRCVNIEECKILRKLFCKIRIFIIVSFVNRKICVSYRIGREEKDKIYCGSSLSCEN